MTKTLALRRLGVFLLLGILCCASPALARTLRVGVYHNPPMIFQNESGKITGFYPRLLESIAREEGWTIEYLFDTFANHLERLRKGELDLLTCIAYSSERAQTFDFNQETVWLNWGAVYAHPSISVQSFLDLNSQKIFVVADDIYHQGLREIVTGFGLDCRFIEAEDYEEVLQKARDEKGIGVVSRIFGLLFGSRYKLKPSPLVFSPVSLRLASPKGKNQEVLKTLDRWLSRFKDDPQSVYHRAIHEFLEFPTPWKMPRWMFIILVLTMGTVIALTGFTSLLRHQVARKTREVMEKNISLQEEIYLRQEAEAKISFRLALEQMLTQVSTQVFSSHSLDTAAHMALEKVGNFLQAEYLLTKLPQESYSFKNPRILEEPESLLPKLLEQGSFREKWEKEGAIILFDQDDTLPELKKSVFFALSLRFSEGEGVLEGVLGEKSDNQEEVVHHLTFVMHYLRTLFEYIWAAKQEREKDRWFMVTLKSLGDAVIATDADGRITFLNPAAEKFTGWTQGEAQGRPVEEVLVLVNENTGKSVENPVRQILQSRKGVTLAHHALFTRRSGEKIIIDDSGTPILDEEGVIRGAVLVFRDITDRRRLEAQIQESERTYRLLFNSMLDGFAILEQIAPDRETLDYLILEANPALQKLFSHFDRIEGRLISELLPDWRERLPFPSPDLPRKREVALPEFDAFWEITSFAISPERIGIIITDVTNRKKAEEKIRYFTFHDNLTGLYNRLFAEEELKRLDDGRYLPLSILFADLNGLKFINDTFGHQRGDVTLRKVAQILQASCRESDIIARWGGDEFLIILPCTSPPTLTEVAERITKRCREAQTRDPFFLGLSIGIATKTELSEDLWTIIQEAEGCSYERKIQERKFYQGEAVLALLKRGLIHYHIEDEEALQQMEAMSGALGKKLDLSEEMLKKLKMLSRFHDVGKLIIPVEILCKKETLTPEEREILQSHPVAGYRIARINSPLAFIAEEIYAFREHWDGTGYPRGKRGEEIPLLTRLAQVVEAYLALLSARPYRPQPFPPDEAIEILKEEGGRKFDPKLVTLFLETLLQGSGFPSAHPQE